MRKRILYSVIALLLIASVVVLCVLRWSAWFGNLPEEAYTVATYPHNFTLLFGDDATSERTITFRADTILRPTFIILQEPDADLDTIWAKGRVVASRAGKAAFYKVELTHLEQGDYSFVACSGVEWAGRRYFTVRDMSQTTEFVLLGDVQDREGESSVRLFDSLYSAYPDADFIAQVGDMIERPMDKYWQYYFLAYEREQMLPIVAATGNHEYLKGVVKHLDARWTSVFYNPQNGYERASGRSYLIDFPLFRLIVLDTDGLTILSDYTRANTWLQQSILQSPCQRTIVVMHHSIYSAGMGRNNAVMRMFFERTLKKADVVIAGHDHTYARQMTKATKKDMTPMVSYVIGTSDKVYINKVNSKAARLCSEPAYMVVKVDEESMELSTYLVEDYSLYDQITITADTIIDHYAYTDELLMLPERYLDKNNSNTRAFNKRVKERVMRQ